MTISQTDLSTRPRPLRLWPGVAVAILTWVVWFVVPKVIPTNTAGMVGALGGLAGGVIVILWWVLFSRAPWSERLGALVLMVVGLMATRGLLHESIATAGMSFMFYIYAVPIVSFALVLWAVATRRSSKGPRWATLVTTILLASGLWTLLRTDGVFSAGSQFAWRWSETSEERLLVESRDEPMVVQAARVAMETEAEWPGFRGSYRDGVIPGVRIETDWAESPPTELWRRPIGPGWSSFAVHGDLLYTQEQRGEDEIVACYDATSGKPIWRHRTVARFWEANAGAGPRGTPTLSDGRVYTFGATGILNVLEAPDGAPVWSRDVASDTGVEIPYWGFSSSPVVVDEVVIVAAEGRLAAYELGMGELQWMGPAGGQGYSSPHLLTLDGVAQVVLLSGTGAISVAPGDGTVLWEHPWPGYPIVQPAQIPNGDVLINGGERAGIRRLEVANGAAGWTVEERWTSTRLKPYFNDFVVHKGHAYGFDGSILACIGIEDGERKWKGGRYGQGQLVLLADQDLLLVVSDRGELALVAASADGFTEVARFSAIEGKTWNHPVLVDDLLLVRNSEEMAAFRLALAGG